MTRAYPEGEPTPTKIKGMKGNGELMTILLKNLAGAYRPRVESGEK